MAEEEFEVIMSALSEKYTHDGMIVHIDIYQDGEGGWILEVVDDYNNSTVWEDPFPTDAAALNEAHEVIHNEGIKAFIGGAVESLP